MLSLWVQIFIITFFEMKWSTKEELTEEISVPK